MKEHYPNETPGFYHEELPRFDHRQAWTGRLESGFNDQTIRVGDDEELHFPAILQRHTPLNRAESQLSLIRQVVHEGTARVPQLARLKALTADIGDELDKLSPQSDHLSAIHEILRKTLAAEEIDRGNEIIYRAAGYIAARDNLWIITKSVAAETMRGRPRDIGMARLVGLTFSDTEQGRPLQAVVKGKNDRAGKLIARHSRTSGYPRLLDVIESTKTR